MTSIYVDGKEYEVNGSGNVLEACLSLGFDIPYFCWHSALGSVGSCRQCAVKQYQKAEDTRGQLVMSCMTAAVDGTLISIADDEVTQFRRSIIEWLMINHPHDCPVCEEGGNCHLQDMTVMVGQNFRRYRFTKRTHQNQYLGPLISHEMNRCISCYRCVRYYKDYADGNDLGVYGTHDNLYFGRFKEGRLENEFSGNLVEICPTGVFNDKAYSERYTRKWDMQFAPSVCQQCSVGCNISPGERYGELRCIANRYNGSVNHYFLCDRGRFGYGYVNLKDRPHHPSQRCGNDWISLNFDQAMQSAVNILCQSRKIIGIGSPRASIESNFALRELVGAENFYSGISREEQKKLTLMLNVLQSGGIHTPSLREMEDYDAVFIVGEDLTQTGARMALAVRQAIKGKARDLAAIQKIPGWQISAIMNIGQDAKYPLFITNIDRTRLDDIAAWSYCAPVEDQARFAFAIAHGLDDTAPEVYDLDQTLQDKIDMVVQVLATARKPLIISGSNAGSGAMIAAAANVARALQGLGREVGISFVASDVNSMGLALMGGESLDDALNELEQGVADSVIVLENDLYRHAPASRINQVVKNLTHLIVLDHQRTALQEQASLILSASCFAEGSGTVINQEGRAQRFFQVYDPTYYDEQVIMLESWRWLHSLHSSYLNRQLDWLYLDDIIDAVTQVFPQFAGIKKAAPDAAFRINGQKLARAPHRYSGRTAMRANISVHEPRVPLDHNTMFTFSMEGNNAPHAARQHVAFAWAPNWNSSQSWNKFQDEIGGHLYAGDPGVRLFEGESGTLDWFNLIPSPFTSLAHEGVWRVAPYWHLFGSEETSQCSPLIQELMPAPYITVSQVDASRLSVTSGTFLAFSCAGQEFCLPVRLSDGLSDGQIGLPLGLPGIPPILSGLSVDNLREVGVCVF